MTTKEVNDILKHGTIKDKIILYFEDIAMHNTTGQNAPYGDYKLNFNPKRLTAKQMQTIWTEANKKEGVKYLTNISYSNKIMVNLKPYIEILYIQTELNGNHLLNEIRHNTRALIATKQAPQIDLGINEGKAQIKDLCELLNINKISLRFFINVAGAFLKQYLPLRAYLQYLDVLEHVVKQKEKAIFKLLDEREQLLKENNVDMRTARLPFNLNKLEDLKHEVKDAEIENIKNLL